MLQRDMVQQKEKVRAYFDRNDGWKGEMYDRPTDRFSRAIVRRKEYIFELLENIDLPVSAAVLDVGCGSGVYVEELARRGFRTYGIDYSEEMLQVCGRRLDAAGIRNVEILRSDVERLPFSKDMFDVVLCIGVLGYLVNEERSLTELYRVLKPGGYLILNVENMISLSNLDYLVRQRVKSFFLSNNGDSHPKGEKVSMISPWVLRNSPTHHEYRLFHPGRLQKKIEQLGFKLVDRLTFGYEFRIVRTYRILSPATLDAVEVRLERWLRMWKIPFLSTLGEAYTGLFQKQ